MITFNRSHSVPSKGDDTNSRVVDVSSGDDLTGPNPEALHKADVTQDRLRLNFHERWSDAALHAKAKVVEQRTDQAGRNDPKSRWRRAVFLANRLANGRAIVTSNNNYAVDDPLSEKAKILETQHWLEIIDRKHRYGSNMKYYFRRWQEEDTSQNFFYWLDQGGGKDLDLKECPRDKFERERIVYLSAEQRLN